MRLEFLLEICYRVARCMTERIVKTNIETLLDKYSFTAFFSTHSEFHVYLRDINFDCESFQKENEPHKY